MKKSRQIRLTLLIPMASIMLSCRPAVEQRCVDQNNKVMDDKLCEQSQPAPHGASHPYHWYYGGRGYVGGTATGGGSTRPEGATVSHPNGGGTVRGVFGSSAHGEAAGE